MTIEAAISTSDRNQKTEPWVTLPSYHYFDEARYQQELETIWYRNWLYVCRSEKLKEPRAFHTFEIGSQNIIVLRDDDGELQAFHNTCRHRGSRLCLEQEGTLSSRRIVCPYHQWTYSLQGKLAGIPLVGSAASFSDQNLSLYQVAVREWGGSVFVNLADDVPAFDEATDPPMSEFVNWPLDQLVVGHTWRKTIKCNWKIFWENFQECYHCPGIHPELCEMVPLYKRGLTATEEVLNLQNEGIYKGPFIEARLRDDAETWSMDGQIHGGRFEDLSPEDLAAGYKFLQMLPTMYMVAHADYVRLVSLSPLGPETTQLTAEWLFLPETLQNPDFDLKNVTEFATLVMSQDGEVCELNQLGLHSIRHHQGVLVPHEYDVHEFLQWVRSQMKESEE